MADRFARQARRREAVALVLYFATTAAVVWLPSWESFPVGVKRDVVGEIAQLTASISASLLGFLLAAVSILLALSGQRLLVQMKKSGHYRKVMRMFRFAVITQGALLAVSLLEVLTVPYCTQVSEVSHLRLILGALWLAAWPLAASCYYLFLIVSVSAESPTR